MDKTCQCGKTKLNDVFKSKKNVKMVIFYWGDVLVPNVVQN